MTKYIFLKYLDLTDETVNALSSNLDSIVSGDDKVLVSPYLKSNKAQTILSEWDSIFEANRGVINEDLFKLETSNKSKFGPRSIAIPWIDRQDAVNAYFTPEEGANFKYTVSKASRNLRPKSLRESVKYLKNNTNSGLPFYKKKGLIKDQLMEEFDQLLKRKDPCVMFTRTQELKKTRTVWGYPVADTLNEMRYYAPLLEHQRKLNWRNSIISPEAVNSKMTQLIDSVVGSRKLLSIDFSAYDTSLKFSLQREAFGYIKSLFQPSCDADIEYIFERFNTIDLITPDGIKSGSHGVPSGSTFTNEVDSICQYLVATSFGLDSQFFDIQGDDGAYCLDDPDSLKRYFTSFGLKVNDEKSYISDEYLVYLQNLYHRDYRQENGIIGGIYSTYRALNRILYLERFTDFEKSDILGKDYFSLRTISILENCKYSPLFKELVRFVYSLDKYKLEYSQQGLTSYIKNMKSSSGVGGVFKFRYEDDLSGINSFETVKLLKTFE